MIIVLAPSDGNMIRSARRQSNNFPEIYGQTYLGDGSVDIPRLDETEDLFFTGHGLAVGASGNAEIGDEDGDFALDGLELWDNFKDIFPDMYQGRIYIDACHAADFGRGMFSLIETFSSQSNESIGDTGVYGRSGDVGYEIPRPGDAGWISAQEAETFAETGSAGPLVSPAGPWDPGREAFTLDGALSGMSNLSAWRGAVDTQNQQLSGELRMTAYQLESDSKVGDFYCVFGSMSQGVVHGDGAYDPTKNWVSVGYYATTMSLVLDLEGYTSDALLWDHGPTSTVGEDSVGFNIGANLSGGEFAGEPVLQAGVDASFGISFSSPDVRFAAAPVGQMVRWDVSLPGVGFISPAVPANPKEPSYAGYLWYFGAIYAVPKGAGFRLRVRPSINWEFDYTRGINYDDRSWSPGDDQTLFTFVPQPPKPPRG